MKKSIFTILFLSALTFAFAQSPIKDFTHEIKYENCETFSVEFTLVYENKSDADSLEWDFGDSETKKSIYIRTRHTYKNPGLYDVTLTLWKDGIKTQVIKNELIKVKDAPDAYFTHSLDTVEMLIAPVTIDFYNKSIKGEGDSLKYEWFMYYMGGHTDSLSTDTVLSLDLNFAGEYRVGLSVSDENGCISHYSQTFIVKDSIQIDEFDFITSPCENETNDTSCNYGKYYEYYNDTIRLFGSYLKNCCTNETAVLQNQGDTIKILTFETGMYCDCYCSFCFEITIPNISKDSCLIDFGGEQFWVYKNNSSETKPQPIQDFASYDYEHKCDSVTSYFYYHMLNLNSSDSIEWNFGDGTIQKQLFKAEKDFQFGTQHTYNDFGQFKVTMTNWINGKGYIITKDKFIYPHFSPQAEFSYKTEDSLLTAPVSIDFENLTQNFDTLLLNYEWLITNNFNDKSLSSQDSNANITFDTAGIYSVTLKSFDSKGCSSEWNEIIEIKAGTINPINSTYNGTLKITPNPFDNFVVIENTIETTSLSRLTIFNLNGQKLLSEILYNQRQVINLSQLHSGIYVLEISNNKNVVVDKIIKK